MKLYTYTEAAELFGLAGRSAIWRRLQLLADRGEALTAEAGELLEIGARMVLTEIGIERLRNFEKRKPGPKPNTNTNVHQTV